MKINLIFLITLLCSTAMISAAADDKKEDDDDQILTFYTEIPGANIERKKAIIMHSLELNRRDTFSGKTFGELFHTNASSKNLPWIISAYFITTPHNQICDYLDLVEIMQNDSHRYQDSDFESYENISQLISEIEGQIIQKHYPTAKYFIPERCCFYYSEENFLHHSVHDVIRFTGQSKNGKNINVSDLSCTLSIALHNNYSQLVPMLSIAAKTPLNPVKILQQKIDFWLNTFNSLPDEKRDELIKECNECYEWEIARPNRDNKDVYEN